MFIHRCHGTVLSKAVLESNLNHISSLLDHYSSPLDTLRWAASLTEINPSVIFCMTIFIYVFILIVAVEPLLFMLVKIWVHIQCTMYSICMIWCCLFLLHKTTFEGENTVCKRDPKNSHPVLAGVLRTTLSHIKLYSRILFRPFGFGHYGCRCQW